MREIKVRAWDTKERKYLYSEKQGFICTTHSNGLGVVIPHETDNPDVDWFDWASADLIMGRYELEQSTGLKDKNGKEVYEGDVVEGDMGVFEVKWFGLEARFIFSPNIDMKWHPSFVWDQVGEMEVIGNIRENPELLRRKNR